MSRSKSTRKAGCSRPGGASSSAARLIQEAQRINHLGKMLAPIIDDAHLLSIDALRRIRLLLEDFPKNHNLILVAQPSLLNKLSLTSNEDIKSRVTYSVVIHKLAPDAITDFIPRPTRSRRARAQHPVARRPSAHRPLLRGDPPQSPKPVPQQPARGRPRPLPNRPS